jgi:signal transduction histidine kinase
VLQEALTNVLKHAHAHRVDVSVVPSSTGVVCKVRDDGHGFDLEAAAAGRGLGNMRTRATRVNAALTISSDRTGTIVEMKLDSVSEQQTMQAQAS